MLTRTLNEVARGADEQEKAFTVDASTSAQSVDDKHLAALAQVGLTDEQSRELFAVLETIARGFVEYAWSGEVCGQLLEGFQEVLSSAIQPLESTDPNQEEKGERSP